MTDKLDAEQRRILNALLGFGDAAADMVDAATDVLVDLSHHPIGMVQQCRASQCKAVRIRVLRDDKPDWKYVWPRKDARVGENEQCHVRQGRGHEFTILRVQR